MIIRNRKANWSISTRMNPDAQKNTCIIIKNTVIDTELHPGTEKQSRLSRAVETVSDKLMPVGQSTATPKVQKGGIENLGYGCPMIRLLPAVAAIAVSSSLAYGITPNPPRPEHIAQQTEAAAVIGSDKPVFLGRMVVTATPLPAN